MSLEPHLPLNEACDISGGWTTAAAESGTYRLVRTTDLSAGSVNWPHVPYSAEDPPNPDRYLVDHGDILVGRTGQSGVGRIGFVDKPPYRALFASYLLRLRPRAGHDGRFLSFYLRSDRGREELLRRSAGASIPNLSAARIGDVPVPRLDLDAQLAVANLLARADDLQSRIKLKSTYASKLLAQVARTAFSQAATPATSSEHSSWPFSRLVDVTDNLDRFRIPLNAGEREVASGPTPYFGASGIIDHVEGYTHEGLGFLLVSEDGANLISRSTPIAFTADGRLWANNHVHVLRPKPGLSAEFLALAIDSLDISRLVSGTAQPKLSKGALGEIRLQIPELDKQVEIVQQVAALRRDVEAAHRQVELVQHRTDEAWKALLETALTGRLPTDLEPLEELARQADVEIASNDKNQDNSMSEDETQTTGRSLAPAATPPRRRASAAAARTVAVVLAEHPKGLTPEALLSETALLGSPDPDAMDNFFAELKSLDAKGTIEQIRTASTIIIRLAAST